MLAGSGISRPSGDYRRISANTANEYLEILSPADCERGRGEWPMSGTSNGRLDRFAKQVDAPK